MIRIWKFGTSFFVSIGSAWVMTFSVVLSWLSDQIGHAFLWISWIHHIFNWLYWNFIVSRWIQRTRFLKRSCPLWISKWISPLQVVIIIYQWRFSYVPLLWSPSILDYVSIAFPFCYLPVLRGLMTGSFCIQVTLSPTELFCDSEFLKNILDFFDVLHHMSIQQQRVI